MKEKYSLMIAIIAVILIILSAGCINSGPSGKEKVSMTLEPEVKVTNTLYNQSSFSRSFPEPEIWDEFNEVYGGKCSDRLLNEIIGSMKSQAKNLSEDPSVLENCLMATGQFDEPNNNRLPCYAEKARFEYYINYKGKAAYEIEDIDEFELGPKEVEPCWIFVLNWGMGDEPLGHIKIYAISTVDHSELFYETCG